MAENQTPADRAEPTGGTTLDPMNRRPTSLDETDPMDRDALTQAPPQVKPMGKFHG